MEDSTLKISTSCNQFVKTSSLHLFATYFRKMLAVLKEKIQTAQNRAERYYFVKIKISRETAMGSMAMASNFMRRLEGKVALITGAASGIGESTARLFSKYGAKLMIADIQVDLGEEVCKKLGHSSASFVHCDVTKESDIENAVDIVVAKYGKLDKIYNNAGIAGIQKQSILDYEKSEFEKVISVNIVGVFLGSKHAARVMIPNRRGSIITTASVCSTMGGGASHAYTSSKHGVVGLTRNMAVELGKYDIRVNCVSPHLVATPLKKYFKLSEDKYRSVYSHLKGVVLSRRMWLKLFFSWQVMSRNTCLFVDDGFTIMNSAFSIFNNLHTGVSKT